MPTVTSGRHLVQTREGQMHIRASGDGGTPLVLLHSQIVSSRWYDLAVPMLATDRLVLCPDRIGYGDSDPASRRLSFPEYAQATLDGLDALGVVAFDAVGIHSGGLEAVELAAQAPDRVRRVATITAPLFTDEERATFKQLFGPPPPTAEDGSHLLFSWNWWNGLAPEGVGLDTVQTWVVDHFKAWPNYWWTFEEAIDYPLADKLPAIQQPLLLLVAHDDIYEQTKRALPLLPASAEVIDLPHMTNVMGIFTTHVEETCGYLRRFLTL
jgi:pimeloyl-ACP methyl ester carboxylesterase